jgi:hypothetical protein
VRLRFTALALSAVSLNGARRGKGIRTIGLLARATCITLLLEAESELDDDARSLLRWLVYDCGIGAIEVGHLWRATGIVLDSEPEDHARGLLR